MARHSYERARWNRREARRRMVVDVWPFFVFTYSHLFRSRPECFFDEASVIDFSQSDATLFRLLTPEQQRKVILEGNQKRLSASVHGGLCAYTRRYRRLWRRRGHEQERLHRLELHDEAQELDPQPRRLGVMWDIW